MPTILLTYLLVAIAAMMYAGVGAEGLGLGNEETSSEVFGALAEPVMGKAVAAALPRRGDLQPRQPADDVPAARAHAARDGRVPGDPHRFAHVHPRFQIPSYATLAGIATGVFYAC